MNFQVKLNNCIDQDRFCAELTLRSAVFFSLFIGENIMSILEKYKPKVHYSRNNSKTSNAANWCESFRLWFNRKSKEDMVRVILAHRRVNAMNSFKSRLPN